MSQRIYPELSGQAWPVQREHYWPGEDIQTTPSGREFSSTPSTYPRIRYGISYPALREDRREADQLVDFYDSVYGRIDDFLYRDRTDCYADKQFLAIGTGAAMSIQLGVGINNVPVNLLTTTNLTDGWPSTNMNSPTSELFAGVEATYVTDTTATGAHTTNQTTIACLPSTTYTVVWRVAPDASRDRIRFDIRNSVANTDIGVVNVTFSTGSRTTSGPGYVASGIEQQPDGFYLVWLTATTDATSDFLRVRLVCQDNSGATTYTGTNTGYYVDGVSLYAGTYIGLLAPVQDSVAVVPFLRPIFDLSGKPKVYLADSASGVVLQTSGYSVNSTGLLTITPAAGQKILWSGGYYQRCRFDMGSMTTSQFANHLRSARSVQLVTRKL